LLTHCAEWQEHHSRHALAHYAEHLAEARLYQERYALLDKPWRDAQFKRTDSHCVFAGDVRLAIEAAWAENPPNLTQVIRRCLIYGSVTSLVAQVPSQILGVLTHVDQVGALDHASLIHSSEERSDAYRLIGETLQRKDEKKQASR
jgi:hypothetical protein